MITNGYGASSYGGSFYTFHWDLATQYLNKETNGTVGPFRSGYVRQKSTKTCIFITRCEGFTTGQEIDFKYFEAFFLETLVEDKKLFFEPFFKASLITGTRKKKGGLSSFWFTCQ